jgi:hypothetical protein
MVLMNHQVSSTQLPSNAYRVERSRVPWVLGDVVKGSCGEQSVVHVVAKRGGRAQRRSGSALHEQAHMQPPYDQVVRVRRPTTRSQ